MSNSVSIGSVVLLSRMPLMGVVEVIASLLPASLVLRGRMKRGNIACDEVFISSHRESTLLLQALKQHGKEDAIAAFTDLGQMILHQFSDVNQDPVLGPDGQLIVSVSSVQLVSMALSTTVASRALSARRPSQADIEHMRRARKNIQCLSKKGYNFGSGWRQADSALACNDVGWEPEEFPLWLFTCVLGMYAYASDLSCIYLEQDSGKTYPSWLNEESFLACYGWALSVGIDLPYDFDRVLGESEPKSKAPESAAPSR